MLFTLASSGCRARHRVFINLSFSPAPSLPSTNPLPLPCHLTSLRWHRARGSLIALRVLYSTNSLSESYATFVPLPLVQGAWTPTIGHLIRLKGWLSARGRPLGASSPSFHLFLFPNSHSQPSVLSTRVAPDGAAEETLVPPHQGNRAGTHRFHPHHLEHLFLHRYLPAGLHARPQS
ncbi:hypothetical protein FA13DRAFT_225199 [Coprinellus micaceus]|uniref:Uncharacterized protein n=1 Tax=Coprinellus micaceus TaxID=71717 RepID=A0A4Y7TGQ1_COPMI|nr:hypothetical protein FA13DRAFT_225199 [Coprinellus micaceus]